jgi:hypothetical protein
MTLPSSVRSMTMSLAKSRVQWELSHSAGGVARLTAELVLAPAFDSAWW